MVLQKNYVNMWAIKLIEKKSPWQQPQQYTHLTIGGVGLENRTKYTLNQNSLLLNLLRIMPLIPYP